MSIITSTRGDLLPLHNPYFGPLQPSGAMPAPMSQHLSNTFPPPVLEKSRLDDVHNENTYDSISSWRKGLDQSPRLAPAREVLTHLNTNTSRLSSRQVSGVSTSTSIPRPSPVPDVFEPAEKDPLPTRLSLSASKRTRDPVPVSTSKRVKIDKIAKTEEEAWRSKWVKSFPTLVFHFELGSEGHGKALEQRVKAMGARVDQFFSTRVTHLVAKSAGSPKKPMAPPSRKIVRESPKNPFLDGTGVTDLVQKAEALNIKVWTVEKLVNMLSRLAPESASAKDSLHTLLEDERIHGTRERDANAPRPDYHYFKPGVKYILIEDATNRHRTVMVKEYGFTQKDGPDWPILHERFLRPSAANQATVDLDKIRARAWSLYVDRKSFEGEAPPVSNLKRSTSLRSLPCTPKLPDALPYQDASGNSVVLTSNIASTSTANNSPALFGQNAMGMFKDRALMQMNKRVQVLKGNAQLAAAKRSSVTDASIAELSQRRASTGNTQPCIPPKTFLSHWQLCRMLDQAREPVINSEITVEMRMRNREKVDAGLKGREQESAAGYCENCRLRYNDLSVHIASKKHLKFARNNDNFASLDQLISTLNRPPNRRIVPPQLPPCDIEHNKNADCSLCEYPGDQESLSENVGDSNSPYEQCSETTDEMDGSERSYV